MCPTHRQFNFCGVSLHLQLLKRQGRSLQNFVQHFCSQKKCNPIWLTLKMSLWRHHSKSLSACCKLSRSLCTFSPFCVRLLLHFHLTLLYSWSGAETQGTETKGCERVTSTHWNSDFRSCYDGFCLDGSQRLYALCWQTVSKAVYAWWDYPMQGWPRPTFSKNISSEVTKRSKNSLSMVKVKCRQRLQRNQFTRKISFKSLGSRL